VESDRRDRFPLKSKDESPHGIVTPDVAEEGGRPGSLPCSPPQGLVEESRLHSAFAQCPLYVTTESRREFEGIAELHVRAHEGVGVLLDDTPEL